MALDHLGTPIQVLYSNGVAEETNFYFAYGERLRGDGIASAEKLKFTGHERDKNGEGGEDDLDYLHARYYSPTWGRFLSVDPAMESAEPLRAQSWNRNNYARGNPTKWTDPLGETVSLAELTPPQISTLLKKLEEFTGNEYAVTEDGRLVLKEMGVDASISATNLIDSAIGSATVYGVVARNNDPTVHIGQRKGDEIRLDFADEVTKLGSRKHQINSGSYGLGSVFVHELIHAHLGLRDPETIEEQASSVGPVVALVNAMRRERGTDFGQRGPAYSGPGTPKWHKVNFQHVNPRKPEKRYWIKVREPRAKK